MYSTSSTVIPTSSATSRATAFSRLSPGSTNPARHRVEAAGEMRVAGQQEAVLPVAHRHDHGGVGAGELLGAVLTAAQHPARHLRLQHTAALRAVTRRAVPGAHRDGGGREVRIAVGQLIGDAPEVTQITAGSVELGAGLGDLGGEHAESVTPTQQHQWLLGALTGVRLLHHGMEGAVAVLPQGHRPGAGDQVTDVVAGSDGPRVAAQQRVPVRAEERERGAEMGTTELRHAPSLRGAGTLAGYGGRVHRNSYSLAALAAAAVPGLVPARTMPIATPAEDLDVAGIVGEDGRRVMVLSLVRPPPESVSNGTSRSPTRSPAPRCAA